MSIDKRSLCIELPDTESELFLMFTNKGTRTIWFRNVYTDVPYCVSLLNDPRTKSGWKFRVYASHSAGNIKLSNGALYAHQRDFHLIWHKIVEMVTTP
jgi:hypothetical protein